MNMLLFMYSDFILLLVLLVLSALILWTIFRQQYLSALTASALWALLCVVSIVWLYTKYAAVEPDKNYLTSTAQNKYNIAELARNKQRYFGMTYSGKRKLELITDHFNSATPPNELKWRQLLVNNKLGQYDFSRADILVNQLIDADIAVRGHTLIWGKWAGTTFPQALDEFVNNSETPATTLKREMHNHITTVMHHFKGRITRWDVVNEPLTMNNNAVDDNVFHQVLGENYIAEAFKMARAADADANLFLNEDFRSFDAESTERFLALLRRQLAQGAPIDGIGIQSHHLYRLKNIQAFQTFVNQLNQLGLIFEITELDVPIWLFADSDNPYQAQGDYYRDYSQVCYRSPHCLGVTTWGIDDSQTWLDYIFPFSLRRSNMPLVFDQQMHKKPAYQGVVEALL